jgi:hypothetical protein
MHAKDNNDEYEFYFIDSTDESATLKLLNEVKLQNSYISIKNKSLLTHKGIDTQLLVTKFIDPIGYDKRRNYVQTIKATDNINKIISEIITELTKRALVYKYRAPVEIIFYTIHDINPELLNNTKLIDMFGITKDILINSNGINTETLTKYNISDSSHKGLKLAAELNKLIRYPSRQYLIDYHVNNNIDEYGPQWYNFTSTIQNNCIQYCIDRINEAFTDNTDNTVDLQSAPKC